jgi:hypothetical protein
MKKIMNEVCEENITLRHQLKTAETIMQSGNLSLPTVAKSRIERRRPAFLKKSIDDLQLRANRGNKSELSVAFKEVRDIYGTIQVEEKVKENRNNNKGRRLSRDSSFQLPFPLQRMASTSAPVSRASSPESSRRSSTTSLPSSGSSFLCPMNRYSSLKSSPSTLTTLTIAEGDATDHEEMTPKAVIPNIAVKKDYRIELFKKLKPPPKSSLDSEMTVKFSNLIDHHTSSSSRPVSAMPAAAPAQSKSLNPLLAPIQQPSSKNATVSKKKRCHFRRNSN